MSFANPAEARQLGIATVFQDLAVCELLSVTRNVVLGREPQKGFGPFKWLDIKRADEMARSALLQLGVRWERGLDERGVNISGGERQSLAIARAMFFGSSLLVLDEPTSALAVRQAGRVLDHIAQARDQGQAIILITHNFRHALSVADDLTVLAQGRVAAHFRARRDRARRLDGPGRARRVTEAFRAKAKEAIGMTHQMARGRKRVVIHEDDVGMTHGANTAFVELSTLGTCSSGSVMVPCPWFPEAVAMAQGDPDLDLGVHLTLTSEQKPYRWRPLTAPPRSAGLTDEGGYFWPDVPARGAPHRRRSRPSFAPRSTASPPASTPPISTRTWARRCAGIRRSLCPARSDYKLPILLVKDYNTVNPRNYSGPISNDHYDAVLGERNQRVLSSSISFTRPCGTARPTPRPRMEIVS